MNSGIRLKNAIRRSAGTDRELICCKIFTVLAEGSHGSPSRVAENKYKTTLKFFKASIQDRLENKINHYVIE